MDLHTFFFIKDETIMNFLNNS